MVKSEEDFEYYDDYVEYVDSRDYFKEAMEAVEDVMSLIDEYSTNWERTMDEYVFPTKVRGAAHA